MEEVENLKEFSVNHSVSWGRSLYYPGDKMAQRMLNFANSGRKRKAFTKEQILELQALGYTVNIIPMKVI